MRLDPLRNFGHPGQVSSSRGGKGSLMVVGDRDLINEAERIALGKAGLNAAFR